MPDSGGKPLRVLFCIGVNQNFFDLPTGQGKAVWDGFTTMLSQLWELPGVSVLGTMDDDQHMVGPSDSWPWTSYVLADVVDQPTVAAACNLFRTVQVGEHGLWRYMKIEARVGRPLPEPEATR
ncbi:hypothetical protein OG824_34295 [Streptomyces prunicolor]|uniref:hypothetical protein n=1 Tax=Streptomyces prunicolor TaxID=67348 RepID=UPI00224CB2A8|nr:hypothetical protein [Streptomyces prunicolor]MCX5240292.1 hypothetical protein [Streptomyces prunicolor]